MIEYQKNILRGIEQYKEEIERLKQEIEIITANIEVLQNNNYNYELNLEIANETIEQLKKMLRRCSPWNAGYCKFCLCDTIQSEPHKDDCKYVQFTGGAE